MINTVYFEKGNNFANVYNLYQWDYGQTIEIKDVETNGNVCVQFSMDQLGGNAVPVVTEVKEGSIIAKIPSFVFEKETTQNYNAYAFIYVTDADSGETVKTIKLNIKARPKPEDYIYTEPEKQKYEILENLIKSFLNKNGEIDPKKIPDMYYKEDGLVNTIKEEYLGLDWIPKIREDNIEIFKEQHITVEESNSVGNGLFLHDLNIDQETRKRIVDEFESLTLVIDGDKLELPYVKKLEEDGYVNAAIFTQEPYSVADNNLAGSVIVGKGKNASMQVVLPLGEYTLEVRYINVTPNPLPAELLTDGTPYLEKTFSEILPEITGTTSEQYDNGIPLPIGLELLEDEEYTVKWNGDEYKCVCYAEELKDVKILILGDVYTISGGEVGKEATGEPFVFIIYPEEYQTIIGFSGLCTPIPYGVNETVTFSITGYNKKFRKLPEECLPDSIKDLLNGELPNIKVDKELSEESENPVQNKVVAAAVNKLSKEIDDLKQNGTGGTGATANDKNGFSTFMQNTDIDYAYDNATGAYYTVIRVYRDKLDGTKQYPFVLYPNDGVGKSTKQLNLIDGWYLAINGGIFTSSTSPDGIVIENGVVLKNEQTTSHPNCKPLTIDANGTLGYAEADADANELVANGIVSAVAGFMPIILDYEVVPSSEWNSVSHYTQNAQRQIIGQWGCGDYAIITCEGRSSHNSDGWTMAEAQEICIKHGLKFAYNLDGGGSTETMLGYKHINTIYDNIDGRKVPTFIVFNGKDYFEKPNKGDIEPPQELETYTNLEYITFTGEQYINTGVADKETLGAESEFMIPEYLSGGKHVLSSTNTYLCVITNQSQLTFKRCGSAEVSTGKQVVYINQRHLVSAFVNSNNTYIDGTLIKENVATGSTKSGNIFIGAYGGKPDTSSYRFKGNVYGIKIYDGAEIVRNFVPAMNKAGVAGLLDVVENKFYTSGTDVQCVAGTVLS